MILKKKTKQNKTKQNKKKQNKTRMGGIVVRYSKDLSQVTRLMSYYLAISLISNFPSPLRSKSSSWKGQKY